MKMYQVMEHSIITQYTEENFFEHFPESKGKDIISYINEKEELSLWKEYELEEFYSLSKLNSKIKQFSENQEREAESISIDGQKFKMNNIGEALQYFWSEIIRNSHNGIYLEVNYGQGEHELPIDNTEYQYQRTFVDEY